MGLSVRQNGCLYIYAPHAYKQIVLGDDIMNPNILRLLGLMGGYSALTSMQDSDKQSPKSAEVKAFSNYENSPAHTDRIENDPDYDYAKFHELRKRIRGQK